MIMFRILLGPSNMAISLSFDDSLSTLEARRVALAGCKPLALWSNPNAAWRACPPALRRRLRSCDAYRGYGPKLIAMHARPAAMPRRGPRRS
jgi:hypothetical protein